MPKKTLPSKQIIDQAKQYAPDWLVDMMASEVPDQSDLVNPVAIAVRPPAIAKKHGEHLIRMLQQTYGKPGMMDRLRGLVGLPTKKPVVHKELIEALQFAQKRYPRLFGQLDAIVPLPPEGRNVASIAAINKPGEKFKAHMILRPEFMRKVEKYDVSGRPANAVFHELNHLADGLASPNMIEKYNFSNTLPGGYNANSHEVRARLQGALGERYMKGFSRKTAKELTENAIDTENKLLQWDGR